MYLLFCFTTFCHFSGNFIIASFQTFFLFLSKELSQLLCIVFQGIEIFPLRKFHKDQNKWISVSAMSCEYSGWIRTSQPSCNSFCLVIKKHVILHYPDGRLCVFCWLILNAFQRVLLSVSLIESSTFWN